MELINQSEGNIFDLMYQKCGVNAAVQLIGQMFEGKDVLQLRKLSKRFRDSFTLDYVTNRIIEWYCKNPKTFIEQNYFKMLGNQQFRLVYEVLTRVNCVLPQVGVDVYLIYFVERFPPLLDHLLCREDTPKPMSPFERYSVYIKEDHLEAIQICCKHNLIVDGMKSTIYILKAALEVATRGYGTKPLRVIDHCLSDPDLIIDESSAFIILERICYFGLNRVKKVEELLKNTWNQKMFQSLLKGCFDHFNEDIFKYIEDKYMIQSGKRTIDLSLFFDGINLTNCLATAINNLSAYTVEFLLKNTDVNANYWYRSNIDEKPIRRILLVKVPTSMSKEEEEKIKLTIMTLLVELGDLQTVERGPNSPKGLATKLGYKTIANFMQKHHKKQQEKDKEPAKKKSKKNV